MKDINIDGIIRVLAFMLLRGLHQASRKKNDFLITQYIFEDCFALIRLTKPAHGEIRLTCITIMNEDSKQIFQG